MRMAVFKSIVFMILVGMVVIMMSSATTFVYSSNENFMPLESSINSIGTLLIGEVEQFTPESTDPWLDYLIYVGYSFVVVCTFSEFFV